MFKSSTHVVVTVLLSFFEQSCFNMYVLIIATDPAQHPKEALSVAFISSSSAQHDIKFQNNMLTFTELINGFPIVLLGDGHYLRP